MNSQNDLIDQLLLEMDDIEEGVKTSRAIRTKKSKIKAAGGLAALRIAKEKNDSMYAQYVKFKHKALDLKRKLMKKYGRRGVATARKGMM